MMNKIRKNCVKRLTGLVLSGMLVFLMAACGSSGEEDVNLLKPEEENKKTVTMFSPMEKTDPEAIGRAHV